MGIFAPKGKRKGLGVGFQLFWVALGVGLLVTGGIAALVGQPGYRT